MADRQGLGHAQQLREIATMLRSTRMSMEADAAIQCDQAAAWIERHSRTASDVFAEREPLLDTRGVLTSPETRSAEQLEDGFPRWDDQGRRITAGVKVCPGCKEQEPYCGCVTSGVATDAVSDAGILNALRLALPYVERVAGTSPTQPAGVARQRAAAKDLKVIRAALAAGVQEDQRG